MKKENKEDTEQKSKDDNNKVEENIEEKVKDENSDLSLIINETMDKENKVPKWIKSLSGLKANKTLNVYKNLEQIAESRILKSPIDLMKSGKYISIGSILKNYNINRKNNFGISKKNFLFQVKMSLLQAKKISMCHLLQKKTSEDNKKNYSDLFSNYSNIKYSEISKESIKKYDQGVISINNYAIFKNQCLGKGGFSSVYLCTDINSGEKYAVKVTEKNSMANKAKKKYEYVKEEIEILKRVHSKYIVQIYEVLETKKEIYIVMELMGKSVFDIIHQLTGFQVWRYFRNLVSAVEHCHEVGKIVHRDINVNNLLISNNIAKLCDFGIGMIIQDDNDLISSEGPVTFSPPEKLYSKEKFYSGKKGDIWLLGATLFNMTYKKPLFFGKKDVNIEDYKNIILPVNEKEADEKIDPNLPKLILELLNFDPEKRPNFIDIKNNSWITKNGEFPMPDIYEEAIRYIFQVAKADINLTNE